MTVRALFVAALISVPAFAQEDVRVVVKPAALTMPVGGKS